MLKILHTGDVHLDAPFSSLDSRRASARRSELRSAFTSMMTWAKMTSVDCILIAGDLFDGKLVTKESVTLLARELEGFGKPVFIVPGNHDPATSDSLWMKDLFPSNVRVFTSEALSRFDVEELNLSVYGHAFTSSTLDTVPYAGKTVEDKKRINVLLSHCDLTGSDASCCPTRPSDLLSFGADYCALGHIHNPAENDGDARWAYCGCLEGRAFDELGPKGACLIEIGDKTGEEKAPVHVKRIRFSKRRYEKGELSLRDVALQKDVRDAITAYIKENHYGEDTLLSLRLTGTADPSLLIDTEGLEEDGLGLYLLKLTDDTRPAADLDALEKDVTVCGEVYRQLKPALEDPDPRTRHIAQRALRYALAALQENGSFHPSKL